MDSGQIWYQLGLWFTTKGDLQPCDFQRLAFRAIYLLDPFGPATYWSAQAEACALWTKHSPRLLLQHVAYYGLIGQKQ